jgi:SpoVK/Ycf46/Vps4 family AAA+-type ATPase
VPLLLTATPPPVATRTELWRRALDGEAAPDLDLPAAARFRLTPDQVGRAARAARYEAALAGRPVGDRDVRAGVRAQNGASLEGRARRIEPAVSWDDLVLPPDCLAGLDELATRFRHRDQVLDTWRMRPGGNRGRGITALFAGDSGTGKTMSAEVIAAEFGLDLYAIDLSSVVDKYVGETEKHLDRIFAEADSVNGVLLFDEADAVFGKRSEVRDAHDRYANTEVAYLLQRMESFDGLAILTTNLRANLDDAFTRRLDVIVDFPLPDETQRRQLWDRCLPGALARSDDVDLDFCARRFELSGGNIRSAAVTAAYLAAESGQPVTMIDLVRAIHREYRKLGRLTVESEFGPWLPVLAAAT